MIDEKKIEEAARAYCDATYGTLKEEPFIAESFRQGAQWAQKEFINSLWHDASEKPKDDTTTVLIIDKERNMFTYLIDSGSNWNDDIGIWETVKWCYIDDLLPKEGGEE